MRGWGCVYIFGPGHMTKMVAMPVKTLKKILSLVPLGRLLETWYVASGDLVL